MTTARKVLFVHGLESGPHGNKSRALAAAGYDVAAEEMPCGEKRMKRDPVVVLSALAALGVGAAASARWGARGLAVTIGAIIAAREPAKRAITRRMFERSVAVQLRALREHRPDVVVGSSFGGAVTLELLRQRAWTGPTVLLCPAHELVCEREGRAWESFAIERAEHTLIVHAREDAVVEYEQSVRLARELGVELVTVSDDHQLTVNATSEGLYRWVERAARGA